MTNTRSIEQPEINLDVQTEVAGNVCVGKFGVSQRAADRAVQEVTAAVSIQSDIGDLSRLINTAADDIVGAYAEATRHADAQLRNLLEMLNSIGHLAYRASTTAAESPHLMTANQLKKVAQDATTAINELVTLAREQQDYARFASEHVVEMRSLSGLETAP